MGLADVVEEAQEPYSAIYGPESVIEASRRKDMLLKQVKQKLQMQGFREENITTETYLNLRYEGTDTSIMVRRYLNSGFNFVVEFVKLFLQEYGFKLQNRNILICDVRVHGIGVTNILKPQVLGHTSGSPKVEGHSKVYFENGWHNAPLFKLENLAPGHIMPGLAIIMNENSTVLSEPKCEAIITKYGNIKIEIATDISTVKGAEKVVDIVQLSIFNHRFVGVTPMILGAAF